MGGLRKTYINYGYQNKTASPKRINHANTVTSNGNFTAVQAFCFGGASVAAHGQSILKTAAICTDFDVEVIIPGGAVSIRYEDLLRDTEKTLGFLHGWLDLEPGQLTDLIEKASGRTIKDGKFFWKQQEKNYLNYLSDEQIALFLKYRGDDTAKIGYGQDYMRKRPGPDRDNTTNQSTSFLFGFIKKPAK